MKKTFRPINPLDRMEQDKSGIFKHLLFPKKNLDNRIKARGCVDGQKQRAGLNKRYTTLPTADLEWILITTFIDALKGRNVAMVEITGAFLTANMDKEVHMVLRGRLAELMVSVELSLYYKHVTVDNGKMCYRYVCRRNYMGHSGPPFCSTIS